MRLAPGNTVALCGRIVRLEPLTPHHQSELADIAKNEQIWRYLTSYGGSPDALQSYLQSALRDYDTGSALPFVLRVLATNSVVGMTRLKDVSIQHRKAVVGSWITPSEWGKGANTESKLLLLEYAFESLCCIRIEFHTDSRNERSRAALKRMGAFEEGTLRSCLMTREGDRRDSVLFSILDHEWPAIKQKLLARLEEQLGRAI